MCTTTLQHISSLMRSKNAGPFQITIDLMFPDAGTLARVLEAQVLTPRAIARLYRVPAEEVSIAPFERVHALKITIPRTAGSRGSGSAFDRDVYGAQHHGPLADLVLPLPAAAG